MDKLKNLKIVLLVLVVVLILVFVKTTGKNQFKEDANNTVEKVVSGNFSISLGEFKASQNEYLVVNLNESDSVPFEKSVKIPFEKLIEESSLQKLKDSDDKIVLVSEDESQAERAWIILTQLGITNVFTLSKSDNPEVFKYKFQPVTSAKLE